jgi:DNA-binding SARP family transcriptional activator/ABC-type branched-subunit amino acid transport system substrate-binding protein/outer membrane protein assembly factor BamB
MRYEILGPLEVRDGARVLSLARGRQRVLLTVLLLHGNEVVSSEMLIDALWGESPPAAAVGSLHNLIAALRKALGDGALRTRNGGYELRVGGEELDARRFEALATQGRLALAAADPERATALLREGLALWRGPPLADLAYEPALRAEAARLEELRLEALEERIEADLALGRHRELVPELNALVAEAPLRERLRAQQILALYRSGRQAEALAAYAEARRRLVDELGIEPGPALRRLEQAVLEQDPALGAPDALPQTPRLRPPSRRPFALVAAGVLALVAAGVFALTRGEGPGAHGGVAALAGNSAVAIDPHTNRVVAAIAVGGTPTSIAAGAGAAWALNADDQTISRVDRHGRSVRTVGIGATPTDLAAGGGDLWVASGDTAYGATGLFRLGADDLRDRGRVDLPAQRHQGAPGLPGQVAVGPRAVWALNGSGELARIDVSTGRQTAVPTPVEARALALGAGALWALARDDNTLLRLDARTGALRSRIEVPATHLDALAAGAGAVWATDSYDGTLWRVDPGPRLTTRTISTGTGTDGVAVGAGAVWTINSVHGTLTRVDPRRNRVAATIDLGGTPRDVDVGSDAVWVTVVGVQPGPAVAVGGPAPLPGQACGRVLGAPGHAPQYLVASDFPLQNGDPETAEAVALVMRQHGFRAGRFRLGYQSCDSSTADSGQSDPGKCAANAKAYAADPAVLGVVGPYNSSCALVEVPILNRATGGPLALISPSTSLASLTHLDPRAPQGALARLYPTGVRNFARLAPSDDQEAAAGAVLARRLGLHRVYVLDDGQSASRDMWARPFARAAPAVGLRVAGAASWDPRGIGLRALAERVRRAGADGAYLGGLPGFHGGALVAALRAELGASFTLIAPNPFTATGPLWQESHGAARGMYITNTWVPAARLGARGRAFVRDFAATQTGAPIYSDMSYAAAATEVLLAAIARSDGTRTGVVRALAATRLSDGILGPVRFDRNGDRVQPPVPVLRLVGPRAGDSARAYPGTVFERVIVPPASATG